MVRDSKVYVLDIFAEVMKQYGYTVEWEGFGYNSAKVVIKDSNGKIVKEEWIGQ